LAAYIPAYKLLTIKGKDQMEIETIVLDSVPRFTELFPLYEQEHAFLDSIGEENNWNKDILLAKNYREYTMAHLKELVRLRYLSDDWPEDFRNILLGLSGKDILTLSNPRNEFQLDILAHDMVNGKTNDNALWDMAWQNTVRKAEKDHVDIDQYSNWTGFDLIFDFYRLRNADKLAIEDIGEDRIKQYVGIFDGFVDSNNEYLGPDDKTRKNFVELSTIFQKFLNGAPADHFSLDMKNGGVVDLSNHAEK